MTAEISEHELPSYYGWVRNTEETTDYEILRDTLIAAFNPPDEDSSEPAVMTDSIDRAWKFITAQLCSCTDAAADYEDDACDRCQALGRRHDVLDER